MSVDFADRTSAPDYTAGLTIGLHVGRLVRIVAICGLGVFGLGAFREVVVAVLNVDTNAFGWNLIHLDQENNLPTWFTSMLLFSVGMTALFLAQLGSRIEPRNVGAWVLLGFFFVLFSVDEIVLLHEMTVKPMRSLGTWTGLFHFAWVVWALPAVALIAVGFVPFVLRVRRATAIRLLIAGAVYVSGALGM